MSWFFISFLEFSTVDIVLPDLGDPGLTAEDKYVIFLSGLAIGGNKFNPLQFQLLVDHITGHLGNDTVFIIELFTFEWQPAKLYLNFLIGSKHDFKYCSCGDCWKFYRSYKGPFDKPGNLQIC